MELIVENGNQTKETKFLLALRLEFFSVIPTDANQVAMGCANLSWI